MRYQRIAQACVKHRTLKVFGVRLRASEGRFTRNALLVRKLNSREGRAPSRPTFGFLPRAWPIRIERFKGRHGGRPSLFGLIPLMQRCCGADYALNGRLEKLIVAVQGADAGFWKEYREVEVENCFPGA